MLGIVDSVLTLFSAYLSIEAKKMIDMKWEVRTTHFKQMGLAFGAVFTNVWTTTAGSKYKAVITIFGMLFYY